MSGAAQGGLIQGISARGIMAGYGRFGRGRITLRGADLEVAPGTVVGLVGPNGAGKTTLIRTCMGFLEPRAGRVRIDGMAPARYRQEHGIGYVPEVVGLPDGWTVRELLREGARLSGVPRPLRADAVQEALEDEGLESWCGARTSSLSKGATRRVALAFALLGEPRVVVMDEPWAGMDPPARFRLRERLRQLGGRGHAVLVSSHDLGEIARVADRCVALRDGRVVGTVDHVVESRLEAVFRWPGAPA